MDEEKLEENLSQIEDTMCKFQDAIAKKIDGDILKLLMVEEAEAIIKEGRRG